MGSRTAPAAARARMRGRGFAAGLEKLEDRIAAAATATLTASGLIFDGSSVIGGAAPVVEEKAVMGGRYLARSGGDDARENDVRKPVREKRGRGAGADRDDYKRIKCEKKGEKKGGEKKGGGAGASGKKLNKAGESTRTTKTKSGAVRGTADTAVAQRGVTSLSLAQGGGGGIVAAPAPAPLQQAVSSSTSGGGVVASVIQVGTQVRLDANGNWAISQEGGSAADKGGAVNEAGGFTLTEGDSFRVAVEQTFAIPANADELTFSYNGLDFDSADDFINDALEISLVNAATGQSLVPTIGGGRDAFLNITEGMGMAVGTGTSAQSTAPAGGDVLSQQTVSVDISGVAAGTQAKFIFRLVNNDGDMDSTVHLNLGNQPPRILTMNDVSGQEGKSVALSATFSDDDAIGTQVATINWGDGTSSSGTIGADGSLGKVSASHIYADNKTYTITMRLTDLVGGADEDQAVATISNVAPTLEAGIGFEAQAGKLATVISGFFTDPGFTRASAGTAETFTATINWGDGATQNVPLTVVQGSEGVLSRGTFAVSHVYGNPGIFSATITVRDDDGGSDSETFKMRMMAIDVVPPINLKSKGVIPVKILRQGGINPNDIVVNSLRFGPAGAPESHGAIHGSGSWGVMTHYATQKSGLRPSDEVAFLTARLPDGTMLVGMDEIDVKGTIATRGGSNGSGTPKFFVADSSADNVYRYTSSGSVAGFYAADVLIEDVRGIAANAAGDTLWQVDANTRAVVIQGPSGSFKGYWNAIDVSSPSGIATDGGDIWIVDASSKKVLHYQGGAARRSGVASATSSFNLHSANTNPSDIASDGSTIWVTDEGKDEVFVYDRSGNLKGRWELDGRNADASGITLNPAGGNDLWVVDRADKMVYHYGNAKGKLSGSANATSTFALASGNVRPEGIADPLLTNPNDTRKWQNATVGTFAKLIYGKDTEKNRARIIKSGLLDDGRFDASNAIAAPLQPTPWATRTGGSPSWNGGRPTMEQLDMKGTGSYAFQKRRDLGPFFATQAVDQFALHGSDTIGDTLFDLGVQVTKAAVFENVDHGPFPQEVIESTVWVSADKVNWTKAVLKRVWLEGWHPNKGIKWDGFTYAIGTKSGAKFRYVSPVHGGSGSLSNDGDCEINAVVALDDNFRPLSPSSPTIFVDSPANNSRFTAGSDVLIIGHALAPTITAAGGIVIPNSIVGVTINGRPVDALDAAGNFFANVEISLGQNIFTFQATDEYGRKVNAGLTLIGEEDDGIDEDELVESSDVKGEYGRTSFSERDEVLFTDLKVRNTGTASLHGPILAVFRNISDASVKLKSPDGTLADGTPYVNISGLVGDGKLVAGETSAWKGISFHNPNRVQFDYDLVVLSKRNEAPRFSTVPVVEVEVGASYSYDAGAVDEDNDTLTFSLVSGPSDAGVNAQSGVLTFNASAAWVKEVVIKVDDGRGGSATQRFVVEVLE